MQKGWGVEGLAKKVGVPPIVIERMEGGIQNPSIPEFKITIGILFDEDEREDCFDLLNGIHPGRRQRRTKFHSPKAKLERRARKDRRPKGILKR